MSDPTDPFTPAMTAGILGRVDDGRRLSSWRGTIPSEVLDLYDAAGFGGRMLLGERPALAVIDVTYAFVGDRPEPILDSVRRFPLSCGAAGWDAIARIEQLLAIARESRVPIFYTQPEMRRKASDAGRYAGKSRRTFERNEEINRIVDAIAPRESETVLRKLKPSAFFGTPLVSHLVTHRVDTLLLCGGTTSGCVRATAVDAFSHNYAVAVVEDATFDRHPFTHEVNLFDLLSKYSEVVSTRAAIAYLRDRTVSPEPSVVAAGLTAPG